MAAIQCSFSVHFSVHTDRPTGGHPARQFRGIRWRWVDGVVAVHTLVAKQKKPTRGSVVLGRCGFLLVWWSGLERAGFWAGVYQGGRGLVVFIDCGGVAVWFFVLGVV